MLRHKKNLSLSPSPWKGEGWDLEHDMNSNKIKSSLPFLFSSKMSLKLSYSPLLGRDGWNLEHDMNSNKIKSSLPFLFSLKMRLKLSYLPLLGKERGGI